MDSEQMTEYERRRLENIKRNDEMMASLNIHSRLSDLSSLSKRQRDEEKKTYKLNSEKKKPKPETPIVIRRSLRARGISPDSPGLPRDFSDSGIKLTKTAPPKRDVRVVLGPMSLSDAYQGEGSQIPFVEKFYTFERKPTVDDGDDGGGDGGSSGGKRRSLRVRSTSRGPDLSGSPVKVEKVKLEDPIDPGSVKLEPENVARVVPGRIVTGSLRVRSTSCGPDLSGSPVKAERVKLEDPIDPGSLRLKPENVARVVPGRIFTVRFLPTANMTMVVAGNKLGNVGFWDVKAENQDGNGIYLYRPHTAPVSGIVVHPSSLSKIYTSCYDGLLRLMDIEKEVFHLIYSNAEEALFSLSQQPNDANSVYFGEGQGHLNLFDGREGKASSSWALHEARINTIDFSSANTTIMATSSTDGLACIWDLRKMDVKHPKPLRAVNHGRAVHSAYFSPSGGCLATTGMDDNVGVLQGVNFEDALMIPHNNYTNRWISSFKAVWGWDDTHLFIGNMKRRVDVLSVTQRKTVYALESPHMSAIPCRYDSHPCTVGMLAGGTGGGQIYLWTSSL